MGIALINTVATICFAEGVANFYRDNFKCDENTKIIIKNIKISATDIMKYYDPFIKRKDFVAIYKRMKEMDILLNTNKDIVYFTSFAISLVETMKGFIKDPSRLEKVKKLLSHLEQLHEIVDDNNFKSYENASTAEKYWMKILRTD